MPTILSKHAQRTLQSASADRAGDVIVNDFFIDLTAAQVAAGNIIELGTLQANMTVSDMLLIPGDLDTNGAPTITLDVGLLSGTPGDVANRTMGAEFYSASTAAQTGAVARPTLASAFTVAATGDDRGIGVKIVTGAATAAAGRIRLRVFMQSANPQTPF